MSIQAGSCAVLLPHMNPLDATLAANPTQIEIVSITSYHPNTSRYAANPHMREYRLKKQISVRILRPMCLFVTTEPAIHPQPDHDNSNDCGHDDEEDAAE